MREVQSNTFKLVVAGGRDFDDYGLLRSTLDRLLSIKMTTHKIIIISGGASGADSLGEWYASENEYEVVVMKADWETFGKSAGYIRNKEMALEADAVSVFWDGVSKGSKHMIDISKNMGIPTRIIKY